MLKLGFLEHPRQLGAVSVPFKTESLWDSFMEKFGFWRKLHTTHVNT